MHTYYVWAEHCSGASVGHPCLTGVFSDPTDQWSEEIEAESEEAAQEIGKQRLAKIVEDSQPCACRRHEQAGSDRWWNSVALIASLSAFPTYTRDE